MSSVGGQTSSPSQARVPHDGQGATDGQPTLLSPPTTGVADPKRWRALAVTQAAAFMILLDVSIVNVALPSIERELGASAASVQWVVSGYALTMGLVLVAAGRLGDTFGRRR